MADTEPQPPKPPLPIPKSYTAERVDKELWPKAKRIASKVPGVTDVVALAFYMNSARAPLQHKLSIAATLAYFVMPFDIIPDFLGAFGYSDDLAVVAGLIAFIGSEAMKPYRVYAKKWLRGEVADTKADPDDVIDATASEAADREGAGPKA